MSLLNSLSGGYKGGDKDNSTPQLISTPKDYVKEILPPIIKAYKNNKLKDIDLSFLVANIQCIKLNVDYSGGIKSTELTSKMVSKLKEDYDDNRLNIDNLNFIIKGIDNIIVNIPQNEIITPKSGKSENQLNTLVKGYKKL